MTGAPGSDADADAEADEAVLDGRRVDDLRRIGPADGSFLVDIVQTFLREAPARLASLGEAVRDGDRAGVMRHAHSLRGQSATMGAVALAARCATLEERASAGDLEGAVPRYAEICRDFEGAAVALRAAVAYDLRP